MLVRLNEIMYTKSNMRINGLSTEAKQNMKLVYCMAKKNQDTTNLDFCQKKL